MKTMYDVLAHLAGQVPDDLLEHARDRLADGDLPEVGRLVRFGRAAFGCTVAPDCYDTVRTVLTEAESAAIVFPRTPVPPFDFHCVEPGGRPRGALDLVAGPERHLRSELCDHTDRALVVAAARLGGLHGLWRAWRTPLGAASWPAPARIVLVESEVDADPGAVRSRLREVADVIVEVLPAGARWPEYHVRALAGAALLWAATPRPAPFVAPGQPDSLSVPDARFLRFLDAGVDVPGGWRTDGCWVWPAGYAALDRTHSALFRHAGDRGFVVGEVDGVAWHQALAAVRRVTGG